MLPPNIARLEVRNHVLNPAEAEIWITVFPIDSPTDAEVRGRFVGPRCHYATTVEVAYPLRPLPGPRANAHQPTARVVIPEPSLWDPDAPLFYQGSVEVWKAGHCTGAVEIPYGLRVLQAGKSALRCNGRPLTIRGVARQQLSTEDARSLRQQGYNTLVIPVSAATAEAWDAADRLGFFVLGRLPVTEAGFRQALALRFHACCLGWLVPADAMERPTLADELTRLQGDTGQLLGLEIGRRPPAQLLQAFQFVLATEDVLPLDGEMQRPVLLQVSAGFDNGESRGPTLNRTGSWGWIVE